MKKPLQKLIKVDKYILINNFLLIYFSKSVFLKIKDKR